MYQFEEQRRKLTAGIWKVDGGYLAGGSINSVFTGRRIADFDFYFRDARAFAYAVEGAYENGFWCVHSSDRSVTFSDNGTLHQYMHFEFFDKPEAIFDAFDFTVCMAAYDFDTKEFVFHPRFLTDCAERKLRFHAGTRFPVISALRVLKYQERGYKIAREDMLQLALACADLNMTSWEDFGSQVGGIYRDRTVVAEEGEFSLRKAILSIAEQASDPKAAAERKAEAGDDTFGSAETLLGALGYKTIEQYEAEDAKSQVVEAAE